MRPDKKKVRHHDSRKRADLAQARARTEEERKAKREGKRVDPEEVEGDDRSYKREIVNNWSHYKPLPSDSEEDLEGAEMTGQDFNQVLQNAVTSDALLRTRSEQEWDQKQDTFTSDFFSLDLGHLEKAVSCVAVHDQLEMDDLNEDCVKIFLHEASGNRKKYHVEFQGPEEINAKILRVLSLGEGTAKDRQTTIKETTDADKPSPESIPAKEEASTKAETPGEDLEDWLDDFLAD